MRALLSLAGLLVVLFIVMKLAGRQVEVLRPAGAPASATQRADQAAQAMQQAMEAAAAARASDASQ